MNVGGRLGAAIGPAAFQRRLGRLKGRDGVLESVAEIELDPLTADARENHQRVIRRLAAAHREHGLSVVVGGGHDHGYSHLQGIYDALKTGKKKVRLGCINVDAHLDVRKAEPVITSGSPFYLALESGIIQPEDLVEFGIQSHCNARELWDYVEKKKVPVVPFERLRHGKAPKVFAQTLQKLRTRCDAIVISFDLDAVASGFAPGVSAPQSEGFTPSEAIEMAEIAGRERKVVSMGIFELNPLHDIEERTAQLAATSAYHFIAHALRR